MKLLSFNIFNILWKIFKLLTRKKYKSIYEKEIRLEPIKDDESYIFEKFTIDVVYFEFDKVEKLNMFRKDIPLDSSSSIFLVN